tara:strand:+ start:331 stop:816 length:486 start_codon:yes stop_codon:yes gene_type:complete
MSKSYSKIRHIQEANEILDRRFLNEVKTSTTLLGEQVTTLTTTVKPVAAPTQAPTGSKFPIVAPKKFGNAPTKFLDFYVNKVAGDETEQLRTAQLFGSDDKDNPVNTTKYTVSIPFTKGKSPNFDFTQTVTTYSKDLGKNPDLADELKYRLNKLATESTQL